MRIIKFRGKSTGDLKTWIYGYPYYDSELYKHYIATYKGLIRKEIDGDTIGQFTGLFNNEKQELYEGDIVEAWSTGSKGTFEIYWRQEGAPMYILYPNFQHGKHWHLNLHGSNIGEKAGVYVDDLKIIGNIHDNPDLLK